VTAMLSEGRAAVSDKMVRLIRDAAERAGVNLFQRWALMRHWHEHNNASFEQLLDREDDLKLHQSDWSTMQVALALTNSIINAVARSA
jgi:hypothetical protein